MIENTVLLFARHLRDRCDAEVVTSRKADLVVNLDVDPGIGAEGFRIADGPDGTITIAGNDERGILYGIGKLLRTSSYTPEGFVPGTWRGISVPEKPIRGMYFATHFHNFYHDAPVADVESYIEDLALWGTNALVVWFDMHHYTGIDDPAARVMIDRLHALLTAANRVGIAAGLGCIANEAYANSPEHLRADWTSGHDGYHTDPTGHYHVELCPNKPGAKELILQWADERLDAFSDLALEYLWIWPYDQGGCTCPKCKPWGANGFLAMAEPIARRFKRRFPRGKAVLSSWYFDKFTSGEWDGLSRAFAAPPGWVDCILAGAFGDVFPEYPLKHGVPGGVPMVSFPEISMYYGHVYEPGVPWGGFGANPFPSRLQSLWNQAGGSLSGGFPYSEGIYEDINKAVCTQLYWQPDKPAIETVREYIAFEFSPDVVEPLTQAVGLMEQSLGRFHEGSGVEVRFVIRDPSVVEETWRLVEHADAKLSPYVRASWRWRIFYLRALIDSELMKNDFRISGRCEEALRELTAIYHAYQTPRVLCPPTRESLAVMRPE